MTVEQVALASAAFVVVGTGWYAISALLDWTKPVLTSWIMFAVTNLLSFGTYWTTADRSLVSNVTNVASALCCSLVLIVLLFKLGFRRPEFSLFQVWSLRVAGGILVLWFVLVGFGMTGFGPNLLTQILMTTGYLVTAVKLWDSKEVSEPKFTWICITIACAVGAYPAVVKSDFLAIVFSVRAGLCSGTLVWLIRRVERKSE